MDFVSAKDFTETIPQRVVHVVEGASRYLHDHPEDVATLPLDLEIPPCCAHPDWQFSIIESTLYPMIRCRCGTGIYPVVPTDDATVEQWQAHLLLRSSVGFVVGFAVESAPYLDQLQSHFPYQEAQHLLRKAIEHQERMVQEIESVDQGGVTGPPWATYGQRNILPRKEGYSRDSAYQPTRRFRRWVFGASPYPYKFMALRRAMRLRIQQDTLLSQWTLIDMQAWMAGQNRAWDAIPRKVRRDWWTWRLRNRRGPADVLYFLEVCNDPSVPIEKWDRRSDGFPQRQGYTWQVIKMRSRRLPGWWVEYRDQIAAVALVHVIYYKDSQEFLFSVLWRGSPPHWKS